MRTIPGVVLFVIEFVSNYLALHALWVTRAGILE